MKMCYTYGSKKNHRAKKNAVANGLFIAHKWFYLS
jgi:hypothetical protein